MMTDPPTGRAEVPLGGGPHEPADHDLLLRMRVRDEAALETFYDRHATLVYTLAMRIVGDSELATEVMQDTFLRCWQAAEQFDSSRGRVTGWLMGVARNRAIDLLRSRQHQARLREPGILPLSGEPGEPGVSDESDEVALHHTVTRALDDLTTAQRQVIELAYYGGLTQTEIADKLGAPLGTVKTRTRNALERLRGLLRPLLASGEEAARHE